MPKDGDKKAHKGEGHRQRLRERFLAGGLDGFHDYEVIELLLTLAMPRKDCKSAAKEALKRFKTLQGVLEATSLELGKVNGIGPKNIFGIKLIKAVADRYLEKKLIHKDAINDSKMLFDYLYHSIGDKNREIFKVIFLNSKNQVITARTISEGTLTASSVYPREVIQAALSHDAAALIFAHNHPSGDPKPSSEDVAVTRQLVFAGKVMGMVVHEHLIIGDNRYFSFADQGYITRMNREFEKLTEQGT
ncbi:MAG: DNA repair protein RadC [Desulfobacterales bacterium]|jgi:DNA repair protein RadC|nr:DNA repair protein RadC [Desulfobacterales bacterium]MDH3877066.1 DNA repair protein RadC [Desulfobacterales bacterium]